MRSMHLIKPSPGRKKWKVRFKNWDGRVKTVSGEDGKAATQRLAMRIGLLIEAKQNGDQPPADLSEWIRQMDPRRARRLGEIGLIDAKRFEQDQSITGHIEQYQKAVAARRGNTKKHARMSAAYVTRLCNDQNISRYTELDAHNAMVFLSEKKYAPSTQRAYMVGWEDFGAWMVRTRRAGRNPFRGLPKPRATPGFDRRPYTVEELRKLLRYMDTFDRYPDQGRASTWNANDRKMIYWTAVKTGYRRSEMMSLRRYHFNLDSRPAWIDINAADAKNRTKSAVPIPAELAEELRKYLALKAPAAPVFWLPKSGNLVRTLKRDLREAGLERILHTGQRVDFHCFRVTAIVNWLTVDRLDQLTVQRLARFKSLSMVQKYSRGFEGREYGWLEQSPSLIKPDVRAKPSSA